MALSVSGSAVLAQDASLPISGPGTIVTLGGYALLAPRFEGAKHDDFDGRPIVSFRKPGDRVWLDLPNDGIDYAFVETDTFRAGAVGNLRFARQTDSLVRGYKHSRTIDTSIEAGGFAEYWPELWLRTRAEVRYAFVGADGLVADLSADFVTHPFSERWTVTAGPRLSLADQTFMDSYYSVTPAQSAASGLSTYKADAGVRSFGLGAGARYKWSDAWTTLSYVEYTHLAQNAKESPLIDQRGSPDMFTIGIGAKYSFLVPW